MIIYYTILSFLYLVTLFFTIFKEKLTFHISSVLTLIFAVVLSIANYFVDINYNNFPYPIFIVLIMIGVVLIPIANIINIYKYYYKYDKKEEYKKKVRNQIIFSFVMAALSFTFQKAYEYKSNNSSINVNSKQVIELLSSKTEDEKIIYWKTKL